MTMEQYIAALEQELRHLPKEERDGAISYYREYFEEAKASAPDGAYDPVAEFGEPSELAAQILQQMAQRIVEPEEENVTPAAEQKKKSPFSAVWIVVLAILASPIALPVGIALVAVIFSLVLVVFSVSLALCVAGIASGIAGVVALVWAIPLLFTNGATGLVLLGISLTMLGVAILLCIGGYLLGKGMIFGIARIFGKLVRKKAKEGEA